MRIFVTGAVCAEGGANWRGGGAARPESAVLSSVPVIFSNACTNMVRSTFLALPTSRSAGTASLACGPIAPNARMTA